jgi:hypothetical protein
VNAGLDGFSQLKAKKCHRLTEIIEKLPTKPQEVEFSRILMLLALTLTSTSKEDDLTNGKYSAVFEVACTKNQNEI